MTEPVLNASPKTWDEVKTTTCYMCACRCGIKVHLKQGELRYIQGNPDHPVNRGTLCPKGAGILDMLRSVMVVLIRDSLTVIGLLGYLFWLNWKLTLVTLVLVPVPSWPVTTAHSFLRRPAHHGAREMRMRRRRGRSRT